MHWKKKIRTNTCSHGNTSFAVWSASPQDSETKPINPAGMSKLVVAMNMFKFALITGLEAY